MYPQNPFCPLIPENTPIINIIKKRKEKERKEKKSKEKFSNLMTPIKKGMKKKQRQERENKNKLKNNKPDDHAALSYSLH